MNSSQVHPQAIQCVLHPAGAVGAGHSVPTQEVEENATKFLQFFGQYLLDRQVGLLYLKTENLQVTGSFKVRGAYYKISTLTEEEKRWFRLKQLKSPGKHLGIPYR